MSEERAEVVRRVYDAWARGELPGPIALLDPGIEYVNPPDAAEPGVRRGIEEFGRAVDRVFEGWETWEMTPEHLATEGDRVAVLVRYRARGRSSGVEVEGTESALWTITAGRVIRYEWFNDPAGAFEAAGLPDPP